MQTVDPREIVRSVADELRDLAGVRNIAVELNLGEGGAAISGNARNAAIRSRSSGVCSLSRIVRAARVRPR